MSKTTTFSRVFHPKIIYNFLGKSKLDKKWRFRTVCQCWFFSSKFQRTSWLYAYSSPFICHQSTSCTLEYGQDWQGGWETVQSSLRKQYINIPYMVFRLRFLAHKNQSLINLSIVLYNSTSFRSFTVQMKNKTMSRNLSTVDSRFSKESF